MKLLFLLTATATFLSASLLLKSPNRMPKLALFCIACGLADLVIAVVW